MLRRISAPTAGRRSDVALTRDRVAIKFCVAIVHFDMSDRSAATLPGSGAALVLIDEGGGHAAFTVRLCIQAVISLRSQPVQFWAKARRFGAIPRRSILHQVERLKPVIWRRSNSRIKRSGRLSESIDLLVCTRAAHMRAAWFTQEHGGPADR